MSLVEWSPSMSVGMTLLDDGHRALVGIVDRLYAGTKTHALARQLPADLKAGKSRQEPGPSFQRPPFGQEGTEVHRSSRRTKSGGLSSTFRLLEAAVFHSQRNRQVEVRT